LLINYVLRISPQFPFLVESGLQIKKGIAIISKFFEQAFVLYGAKHAQLVGMNRREFLKRIAAAAAMTIFGFKAGESSTVLSPSAGATAGITTEQMVLGGELFTAYARGGSPVIGKIQRAKLSQTRFWSGWKTSNGTGLQQLLL
jgi:hypothetical protein